MLKIGSESFGLQSSPQNNLVHGRCMLTPLLELVCIGSEVLLQILDYILVFIEEDCAMTCFETVELGGGGLELLFGYQRLERGLDEFPECLVFLVQEQDETRGL